MEDAWCKWVSLVFCFKTWSVMAMFSVSMTILPMHMTIDSLYHPQSVQTWQPNDMTVEMTGAWPLTVTLVSSNWCLWSLVLSTMTLLSNNRSGLNLCHGCSVRVLSWSVMVSLLSPLPPPTASIPRCHPAPFDSDNVINIPPLPFQFSPSRSYPRHLSTLYCTGAVITEGKQCHV